MRVLIIGRSEILYDTALLLKQEHEICGVVSAPATPEATRKESDFRGLADELSCRFVLSSRIDDAVMSLVHEAKPDVAVSVNWVSVIGDTFISAIPHGVLNAHCGNLPRYRGNAVMNWALLRGEPCIHISVHSMVPSLLDMGDVWAQDRIPTDSLSTIGGVMDEVAKRTPALFSAALRCVGRQAPIKTLAEVKAGEGFRCYPRLPVDGYIDWSQSAAEIDRLVRASSRPYPGAFTSVMLEERVRKLIVWRARVVADDTEDVAVPGHVIRNDAQTGETYVFTGRGILAIQEAQFFDEPESFRPGERFRSIRFRLGLEAGALVDLLDRLMRPSDR